MVANKLICILYHASSSGAGTGSETSTDTPLLFPGLPSEVSSSPAQCGGYDFTRAGHRIVQPTLFISFFFCSIGGI